MILFIRNNKNQTIVDLEIYERDGYVKMGITIDIANYSALLLEKIEMAEEIIGDFDSITELKGWLWEVHFKGAQNTADKFEEALKVIKDILVKTSEKYDLMYVED